MYVNVVIKSKTRMTDQEYTYRVSDTIEHCIASGQRVNVPFGISNKPSLAIVTKVFDNIQEDFKTKNIVNIIDQEPIISKELIQLAYFMKEKYMSDLSSAFQTVLPPGDINGIVEIFSSLVDSEDELISFLKVPKSFEELKNKFPRINRSCLDELIADKKIARSYELSRGASRKTIKLVKLVKSIDQKVRFGAKQELVINYLQNNNVCLLKDLMENTGAALSSIKSLEKKQYLEIIEKEIFREVLNNKFNIYDEKSLTAEQKDIYDIVLSKYGFEKYLLHGVTGSGKTEIYLQLARNVIKSGKKVMVLVPEISLTPQTIERFAGRFGSRIAVLHSKLSISERFDEWSKIKNNLVDIVVGTRSSIFAPFDDIGLIIIDEEHELSYISDKNPKYDALDIAEERAKYHNCPLLLGSATPRIESYYKAINRHYKLLELNKRANENPLPTTSIVDMRSELKAGNYSMISRELSEDIKEALNKKEQIILFLNKRGHTSYVFCRKCGYVQKCEFCDSSMTYHKSKGYSICHLCGRTGSKPRICPKCSSTAIKEFGAGTEKLEEVIRDMFPEAKVARMDADTMSKKGSYERIYEQMKNGDIDILIGTQMISKGFDFKRLSVVGIISADISLNIPDFRAQEKTFQLITQVAGRAGRGDTGGKVVIQTYLPNHYAITTSSSCDYKGFYDTEIESRKKQKYPPIYQMLLIRVMHKDRQKAHRKCIEILNKLNLKSHNINCEVIGPNPAVIERINDIYRFNIIIKSRDSMGKIKEIIREKVESNKEIYKGNYRIYIMINPLSIF